MNACDEIVSLTQDLIRIPSMHSRPEEIMRCADFVVQWCGRQGITARKIVHDRTPSVLVMPGDHARLLLMTHVDVALSLVLFRDRLRALERNGRTQGDMVLGLLITGDEETGGENGAARALEGIGADFAIALDGGGPERIVTREKGVVDIMLTATGKAAHGARPWLGRNAIDMLLEDYARIRELFEGDDGGDHWHRTVNFGKIRAGESINQVPHTARGWFNIRFTEDDDPQRLAEAIADRVRSRVEVLSTIPVFASPPSPMTDILLDIAPGAVLTREHGASDARHLMVHGIPGAIWGAEGFGTQHGLEECVSIPSIEKLHDRLSTLCDRLESDGGR